MSNFDERAKQAAAELLRNRGYTVIEEVWKSPAGTADVIAEGDGTLVFADVQARSGADKGFAFEVVGAGERARREMVALAYLAAHDLPATAVRFDNICLTAFAEDRALIRHHVNALGEALLGHPASTAASVPDALPEAA